MARDASEAARLREEEALAVAAIYGDARVERMRADDMETLRLQLSVRAASADGGEADTSPQPTVVISVQMPAGYPTDELPRVKLGAEWIAATQRQALAEEALRAVQKDTGTELVFVLVEWLRERCAQLWTERQHDGAAPRAERAERPALPSPAVEDVREVARRLRVAHGEPLTDRHSTFQAHIADVCSIADVHDFLALLKTNSKVASATHNMWAYRLTDAAADFDDDGESGAGRQLQQLCELMNVQNTAVVVSRWFGGIHLGAARFRHIKRVAGDLIRRRRLGGADGDDSGGDAMRTR